MLPAGTSGVKAMPLVPLDSTPPAVILAAAGWDDPPPAVILGTPVITAIGCDNWGVGEPEEQRQYRSAPSFSSRAKMTERA